MGNLTAIPKVTKRCNPSDHVPQILGELFWDLIKLEVQYSGNRERMNIRNYEIREWLVQFIHEFWNLCKGLAKDGTEPSKINVAFAFRFIQVLYPQTFQSLKIDKRTRALYRDSQTWSAKLKGLVTPKKDPKIASDITYDFSGIDPILPNYEDGDPLSEESKKSFCVDLGKVIQTNDGLEKKPTVATGNHEH